MLAATRIRTDWSALVLGLLLAAGLVYGWRVQGETRNPTVQVEITTASSPDFAVTPEGLTTGKGEVTPSAPEGGYEREVTVRNATGERLGLRVRLAPDPLELGSVLQARVRLGGRTVFEGPVRTLAAGTDPYPLESGASAPLSVLVWVPESAPDDSWKARSASLRLELVTARERG
jgi:hypothetical protein